jgi:hypothetical protein
MEKAAEKRKRREAKKLGEEAPAEAETDEPLDPNDPYYLAKYFARHASE